MLRDNRESGLFIRYEKSEEEAYHVREALVRDKMINLPMLLSLESATTPDNFKDLSSEERSKIFVATKLKKYDELERLRQDNYFLELKRKFAAGEKLLPAEYLYFAMTTDNVDQINPDVLLQTQAHFNHSNFNENVSILYHYRKWRTVIDQKEKSHHYKALKLLLDERPNDNGFPHLILNLHGANFQGADLQV